MLRIPSAWQVAVGLLALLPSASAPARVLTLSKQSDTTAVVRDAADGDTATSALVSVEGRLLVLPGLLAADTVNDLVYVGTRADPDGAAAGSADALRVATYGNTLPASGTLDAPAGRSFVALRFDTPASRLVGVVIDPDNALPAQIFTAPVNAFGAIGAATYLDAGAGCCTFASGIAAWRATTQELFLIGRRTGDTEDQLLRFDLAAASAAPDAYPIVGDRVVALAVDAGDGGLYALARSVLDFSYLAEVSYAAPGAPATLSAIGSAPATCCFATVGPATIDGAGAERALFALTRDATTPGAMQLSRFDFASGNPLLVNAAIEGYGLWTDASAALDRIFADGFD